MKAPFRVAAALLRAAIVLVVSVSMLSCGLFDPRISEEPLQRSSRVDWLNFSALLDSIPGQTERLESTEYEELLTDNFVYQQESQAVRYAGEMLTRLENIKRDYKDIYVRWIPHPPDQFSRKDELILEDVDYEIYLDGFSEYRTYDFSGKSIFYLVYEQRGWMLKRWKDYPDNQPNSFFNPSF